MKSKKIWVAVLIVSAIATWVLLSPGLELFVGINMPFVTITHEQFTCFGFDMHNMSGDKQLGIMMLSGLLAMLPVRTLHLAILKLSQLKRFNKRYQEENEFESDKDYTFNHLEFPYSSTQFPLKGNDVN